VIQFLSKLTNTWKSYRKKTKGSPILWKTVSNTRKESTQMTIIVHVLLIQLHRNITKIGHNHYTLNKFMKLVV